ncbi:MAG TPA: sigma-70 family RNA polymerase sigma factor [Ilumatobacteraceae bacterium]|nr:sigma-70 family RNA polymerase sigma factor [Ilumatobacteraceae bacterium]
MSTDEPFLDGSADRAEDRVADGIADRSADIDLEAEFEAFFASHHDAVLRSLTSVVGNDHDAAVDATQDAFIKAHARWSTVRTYERPDAWVRRIAINTSRDRRRSDQRRRDREATIDVAAEFVTVDPVDADANVQAILDELPARQRAIASMFYVEDRSIEQIAAALGISSGTVKSQLSEARVRLRRNHRG